MDLTTTTLSQIEGTQEVIKLGVKKAHTPWAKTVLLGFMGGFFIALGTMGYHVMNGYLIADHFVGLGKIAGAAIFPIGLVLTLLIGGDLFTGNALIGVALLNKQVSGKEFCTNLLAVLLGNFLGALFASATIVFSSLYDNVDIATAALDMAEHKLYISFGSSIISAFYCNIIVALCVWGSLILKDGAGKLLFIWIAITLFAACGFQHVVANMYIFSVAYFLDSSITTIPHIFESLLAAAIGNFLSGSLFLPVIYTQLYIKNSNKNAQL